MQVADFDLTRRPTGSVRFLVLGFGFGDWGHGSGPWFGGVVSWNTVNCRLVSGALGPCVLRCGTLLTVSGGCAGFGRIGKDVCGGDGVGGGLMSCMIYVRFMLSSFEGREGGITFSDAVNSSRSFSVVVYS